MNIIKLKKDMEIIVPLTPNFIRIKDSKFCAPISISNFTNDELQEIGRAWTHKLITRANSIRNNEADFDE